MWQLKSSNLIEKEWPGFLPIQLAKSDEQTVFERSWPPETPTDKQVSSRHPWNWELRWCGWGRCFGDRRCRHQITEFSHQRFKSVTFAWHHGGERLLGTFLTWGFVVASSSPFIEIIRYSGSHEAYRLNHALIWGRPLLPYMDKLVVCFNGVKDDREVGHLRIKGSWARMHYCTKCSTDALHDRILVSWCFDWWSMRLSYCSIAYCHSSKWKDFIQVAPSSNIPPGACCSLIGC